MITEKCKVSGFKITFFNIKPFVIKIILLTKNREIHTQNIFGKDLKNKLDYILVILEKI